MKDEPGDPYKGKILAIDPKDEARDLIDYLTKEKPTEGEKARLTLKAMMDICSLSISDMPEGFFRHVKFGDMIWKAFELGRVYEKNRVKDEIE